MWMLSRRLFTSSFEGLLASSRIRRATASSRRTRMSEPSVSFALPICCSRSSPPLATECRTHREEHRIIPACKQRKRLRRPVSMLRQRLHVDRSLALPADEPLIGTLVDENGEPVVRYSGEDVENAEESEANLQAALAV